MLRYSLIFLLLFTAQLQAQQGDSLRNSNRGVFVVELQTGAVYHNFTNPVPENTDLHRFYQDSRFAVAYGGEVGFLVTDAFQIGLAFNYVRASQSKENVTITAENGFSSTGIVINKWRYADFSLAANYAFTLSESVQLGPYANVGVLSFTNQINYFKDAYNVEGSGYATRFGAKLNLCLDEVIWVYLKAGYQIAALNKTKVIRESFNEALQPAILTDLNGLRLQLGVHFNFLRSRKNEPINNF